MGSSIFLDQIELGDWYQELVSLGASLVREAAERLSR